jgi:hypothetical protein
VTPESAGEALPPSQQAEARGGYEIPSPRDLIAARDATIADLEERIARLGRMTESSHLQSASSRRFDNGPRPAGYGLNDPKSNFMAGAAWVRRMLEEAGALDPPAPSSGEEEK